MEILKVPQGEFKLARYPYNKKTLLRAWSAADEYLLNYLFDEKLAVESNILIINYSFGALGVALA